MAQSEYQVSQLPMSPLEASAFFFAEHLAAARSAAGEGDLVIILPAAGPDHTDWRQAMARDLARNAAPARINVIGAGDGPQKEALIRYLVDAKGVTGHYCQTHD